MTNETLSLQKSTFSKAAVTKMLESLSSSLKTDAGLANDLFNFLSERNIITAETIKTNYNKVLPITFNNKGSIEQISYVKQSFSNTVMHENIL